MYNYIYITTLSLVSQTPTQPPSIALHVVLTFLASAARLSSALVLSKLPCLCSTYLGNGWAVFQLVT